MDARELVESYDRNGTLGRLTAVDQAVLDAFFRGEHGRLSAELDAARQTARAEHRDVPVDASALSGVNGGDSWLVTPDGKARRELDEFPKALEMLDHPAPETGARCRALEEARPLFARCAYNGLWSPSGTNWQPMRCIELSAREIADLAGGQAGACGLLVLARRKYQSILSDIARLCRFEQASGAESIDPGIWLTTAGITALGHGWSLEEKPVEADERQRWGEGIRVLLRRRLEGLDGKWRQAAEELLASVECDDHRPAVLLFARSGKPLRLNADKPGGLEPSVIDKLVEARSTQRVASPGKELQADLLHDLFEAARRPLHTPDGLECAVFTWHDEVPALIGEAMHRGIEGPDGLMARASLEAMRERLRAEGELPGEMARWMELDGDELEDTGRQIALPARLVPSHISDKLTEAGHFSTKGELLIDHRQRPLTPVRLVKLVRMLSRSFGKFFLSFQNTHPVTGVILVEDARGEAIYGAAGRIAGRMSLEARARGLTSIIKSGPLEIAGPAIHDLLAEKINRSDLRGALATRRLKPILTFQVGLPLGPEDLVREGKPDQHDGLAERLLDKRAPRASLASHYIPRP